MTAFVRVCGPPNSAFLVGYPGISATLVSETSRLFAAGKRLLEFSNASGGYADPAIDIATNRGES